MFFSLDAASGDGTDLDVFFERSLIFAGVFDLVFTNVRGPTHHSVELNSSGDPKGMCEMSSPPIRFRKKMDLLQL